MSRATIGTKKREISEDRQSRQLRRLSAKLIRMEQDVRQKLAAMLHDHIQPQLVGARMHTWEIQRSKDLDHIHTVSAKLEDLLSVSLTSLRSLAVELSPATLKNKGLSGGLNWLKTHMRNHFNFTVSLSVHNDLEPVSEETAFIIFEGVKELLFNAVKHSGIFQADVSVRRTRQDLISIVVSDQGLGFDSTFALDENNDISPLGLFSIQERLAAIGGRMLINTQKGWGTKIIMTVPAGSRQIHRRQPDHPESRPHPGNITCHIKEDMIGILIVDDNTLLRDGLKGLLQSEPDFHILGEAMNAEEAMEKACRLSPDVILMDLNLGDTHGVTLTEKILITHPETKVIGLSMHSDGGFVNAMYQAGACSYLTKNCSADDIIVAIRDAMSCCTPPTLCLADGSLADSDLAKPHNQGS